MEFGERLALARDRAHMTQYQLALAANTRPETISRYEGGRVTPSMEAVERLAAATGCDLTWLITGAGDPGLPVDDAAPDANDPDPELAHADATDA